jgi:hypothetical protein
MVKREAQHRGCAVVGSEIIGLIPRKAIELWGEYDLQLENFSPAAILENRIAAVAGILPPAASLPPDAAVVLQPLVDTLREAVQGFAERAMDASQRAPAADSLVSSDHGPEDAAESHLAAAFAAGEIYERLVQLEATAAPSMLLDWRALKQAAISTARAALESTDAILPSLRDASTVARINTGRAEIEAKLSGNTLTGEK